MEKIIQQLIKNKETIATMESCTGGYIANEITNIEGASLVMKFSAVTYSNEFKINFGIKEETIKKYTVYSIETAKEMAYNISLFTSATYGIGVTGKLNKQDPNNIEGNNDETYIAIYDNITKKYYTKKIITNKKSRKENKQQVYNEVLNLLKEVVRK